MQVVDNVVVPDQPFYAVRNGHIRPNTPISWNYAKHDSWLFTATSYEYVSKMLIPAFGPQITAAQQETGFTAPPPYQNELFNIAFSAFPEKAARFNQIFGCQSNDADCIEEFALLMQGIGI